MTNFSKQTIKQLTRNGVAIIGTTYVPGTGELPFATGETAYRVNDNGTGRVLTYNEVLALAQKDVK